MSLVVFDDEKEKKIEKIQIKLNEMNRTDEHDKRENKEQILEFEVHEFNNNKNSDSALNFSFSQDSIQSQKVGISIELKPMEIAKNFDYVIIKSNTD